MNYFALSGLVNLIVSISLGLIAFNLKPRLTQHKFFMGLCLAIGLWSFSHWQLFTAENPNQVWIWILIKSLNIGSILIPMFYLGWVIEVLDIAREEKKVLEFAYLSTAILLILSFTPWFIKTVESFGPLKFWPKSGFLYFLYLAHYFGFSGYGTLKLLKSQSYEWRRWIKKPAKYLVWAGLIGFLGGATNFFSMYNLNILPYGNILVAVSLWIIFQGIRKESLMDFSWLSKDIKKDVKNIKNKFQYKYKKFLENKDKFIAELVGKQIDLQ